MKLDLNNEQIDLTNEQAKSVYSALIDARYKINGKIRRYEMKNCMTEEHAKKMKLEADVYTDVIMALYPMIKR